MRTAATATPRFRPSLLAGFAALPSILLLAPAVAVAGHPLSTDDAGTVASGEAEIAVSGQLTGAGVPAGEIGVGVDIRAGFGRSVDAGVGIAYTLSDLTSDRSGGVDAPSLDLKWRLLEPRGPRPGLAVRLDYQPTDGAAARLTGHHVGAVLVASWERPELGAHVNLGSYRHAEMEGAHAAWASYAAAAATVSVARDLVVCGELVADGWPAELHAASGLAGLGWNLAPGRVASAGAGVAWQPDASVAWIATVGLTASFGESGP